MAVSSGTSFAISLLLAVLLFSAMQVNRGWLASSQMHTILGGFISSWLFLLVLTAVGNMETLLFGKAFHTKLFPEVVICLAIAVIAAGMVHRVCTTTCIIFSLVGLYYLNLISQKFHGVPPPVQPVPTKRRK